MPEPPPITAVILAGGRASRMGGRDKGLQKLHGVALVEHALRRLRTQTRPPAAILISANRNLPEYRALGIPVWPDDDARFPGPLAGFLSGLAHSTTPLVLALPCDVPGFPLTLCERLAHALLQTGAPIATAGSVETGADGSRITRPQPAFCLMRRELEADLRRFLDQGGRKVGVWIAQRNATTVPFVQESTEPFAFANVNTLEELRLLERSGASLDN